MKLCMKVIFKNLLICLVLSGFHGAFGMEMSLDDRLIEAAKQGDGKNITWLLSQGADVNAQDGSPLREALKNGHLEVARLLLEHNANVEAPSWVMVEGKEYWRYKNKMSLLGKVVNSKITGDDDWTVAENMRKPIVKLLLAYGADPFFQIKYFHDVLGEFTYTPLGLANDDIKKILLTEISNADAERIRKNFYASIHAFRTKKKWANRDMRQALAKQIFDNFVQERMQRAENMLKRAALIVMTGSFKKEIYNMIVAEMKRILSCPGLKKSEEEYSSKDPSAWEPELCLIQ